MLELLPESVRAFAVEEAGRLLLADRPGPGIRRLRDRFGLTQKELAGCLDLRRETMSRIESGRQSPSADVLRDLVRIFTLAHAAREHVAEAEARDRAVDHGHLARVANGLRLSGEVADTIVVRAVQNYGGKRRAVLEDLEEDPR